MSGSLFREGSGSALWNDLAPECFLFAFSPNPEMLRVWPCTGNGMQKKASLTSAEHRMILDSSECGRAAEGRDVG